MDGLIFLETDLFDIALHTAVDRYDLLLHLGIVGEFHITQMGELAADPECGDYDYGKRQDIGDDFFSTVFHIVPEMNCSL